MSANEKEQLQRSWVANAGSWRDAVREQKIDSRRAVTDAAIVEAVTARRPANVLDLGCGEGWLARALAAEGIAVWGVDASAPLIEAARQLGGGTFLALSYEELSDASLPGPFDVVVANFSILEEEVAPIFGAAARMLRPRGALVIQTVHPAFATGERPYVSGWRTETFAAIEGEWPEPMPWYFRTIGGWVEAIATNGFELTEVREPLDRAGVKPLSMILVCCRR
ncbi:MAG TPA: class I SAM-dependent methyltransferase [Thermoanaerobaculia bacterium]|jgi:2-polyprenyl-3-methyl-5-hydroxy-6-metoxy-1,4-benzoquinol methylase